MTSRDAIFARIRQNKPDPRPRPETAIPSARDGLFPQTAEPLANLAEVLAFIGGRLVETSLSFDLAGWVRGAFPDAERIASGVPLEGVATLPIGPETDKATLEAVDVAVLAGAFVVAENAAVWLPEAAMLHRALPFITQHLVLLVPRADLLPTMHEAYARLDASTGYGVFIAGPSKTADIEQSLVIGAHGARSLTLILR